MVFHTILEWEMDDWEKKNEAMGAQISWVKDWRMKRSFAERRRQKYPKAVEEKRGQLIGHILRDDGLTGWIIGANTDG